MDANAFARGVDQAAEGAQIESLTLTNLGKITATAKAVASARAATYVSAGAVAIGVEQSAEGIGAASKATLTLTNNPGGVIAAQATAIASATYNNAIAHAFAGGVEQSAEDARPRNPLRRQCRHDFGHLRGDRKPAFRHLCRCDRGRYRRGAARRRDFRRRGDPDAHQLEDRPDLRQGDGG